MENALRQEEADNLATRSDDQVDYASKITTNVEEESKTAVVNKK